MDFINEEIEITVLDGKQKYNIDGRIVKQDNVLNNAKILLRLMKTR
jgi:hypothetical protein